MSYAEKQGVCSRSCGFQDLLRKIPISYVSWPLQNNEYCNFGDWAFSDSGLEVGLPAFQLPMFAKCDTPEGNMFRSEICSTSLFKASIPAILFGNFKHPLAARSFMFLRAAAHSTSSAFCLHYACKRSHHFVEDSGFISQAESIGLVTELWSPSFVTEYWNVFFLFAMSTMEMCRDWAFSNCGSGAASLSAADVGKMWHRAERRFVGHVCLRHRFPPFLHRIPSIHSLPEGGSWQRQYAPPALYCGCIMPIPSLQLQKTMCLMQRSRGFGHGVVVSKTMQWLCSQLCYVTAANKRTIVEIELLAIVGWKCGCQPFSCRCWQNVTCCRKETCGTCLFKTSITAIPFGNSSIHSLPEASCYWVRQHAPTVRGCVMPIPSLQLYEKAASWREVEGLVTELWSPRFVTMQWLCSQLCYLTAANQRAIFAIELLATVGWKWGCQPFSCRCSQNVTHCRKEICSTCLFKASIPAIPFGISIIHSLPEGGVRSTCSALWLHHAHPFVAATEKNVPHAEKQRVWSRSCGFQDLLRCSDCALSCAMWLLQTNEQFLRLSL